METKRKNLCAITPEEIHARVREEQEQMGLELNEHAGTITEEHSRKGEKIMTDETRILAFQVSEELFARIKEYLKLTGQSQKEFVIDLTEQALAQKADQAEPVGNKQPDEVGIRNEQP